MNSKIFAVNYRWLIGWGRKIVRKEKETDRHPKKAINTLLGFVCHPHNCSRLKPVTSILPRSSGSADELWVRAYAPVGQETFCPAGWAKKWWVGVWIKEGWTDPLQLSPVTEEQFLQAKSQEAGVEPWREQAKTSVRTWARSSLCLSSLAGSVQTLAPPHPTDIQFSIKVVSS